MMGGGETYMEKARRQLNEAESKIKKTLAIIKQQRNQTKLERIRKNTNHTTEAMYPFNTSILFKLHPIQNKRGRDFKNKTKLLAHN